MRISPLSALLLAVATPALALDPPVVADVTPASDGSVTVDLLFVNGDAGVAPAAPPRLTAMLRSGTTSRSVELRRQSPAATVAPGGFARVRYVLVVPQAAQGAAVLSLHGEGGYAFALAAPPAIREAPQTAAAVSATSAAPFAQGGAATSPYRANLQTYNPIYGVFGPGTNSDAKIEVSLQYQLFGNAAQPTGDWKEGIRFGYTQTMYWNLGEKSSPFRDVNYSPELFYRAAFRQPLLGAVTAVRGGLQHLSNGRGGDASRSVNWLYVEPTAVFALHGLTVTAAPRYQVYVGSDEDNPGIARYRGHQALALSVEQPDGFKLATTSRLNIGTGHGAIDADLSYPLLRVIGVPVYAVLQGFTGYGEDLRDYDRRQNRVRLGIGLVR